MTTTPTRTVPRTGGQHVANVVRLHFANPWASLWIPLMILTFIFIVNYAVWQLISSANSDSDLDNVNNGGAGFVLVYMMVVAVQAMNLTFPFALGYGVTRRHFYLGSAVYFALLSLFYATVFTVMGTIERATGGWGLEAHFFAPAYLGLDSPAQIFYMYVTSLLLFFFVGAAVASVYVRWKANGMYVFWAALALALLAAAWFISVTENWPAVGNFLVEQGAVGVLTWSLLVTAAAGVIGYALLRRATPR